jgi:FMN phosphatase YigB (HAD superfamily)
LQNAKAIVFDFIGTLTSVKDYSLEKSKIRLYKAIAKAGFDVSLEKFLDAYTQSHEKYRVVRYDKLIEVTNSLDFRDIEQFRVQNSSTRSTDKNGGQCFL